VTKEVDWFATLVCIASLQAPLPPFFHPGHRSCDGTSLSAYRCQEANGLKLRTETSYLRLDMLA
jgi:hypothetical protein